MATRRRSLRSLSILGTSFLPVQGAKQPVLEQETSRRSVTVTNLLAVTECQRRRCAERAVRFQMMSPVEQTDLILLHYGLVFSKLVGGARMSYSWLTHSSGDTLRGENVKQTTSRVQAAESKLKKAGISANSAGLYFIRIRLLLQRAVSDSRIICR